MALTSASHEPFFVTTGTGKDKVSTEDLTTITNAWAAEKAEGCAKYIADPVLAPLIYQLQKMQDELDYLRTEISANKDKTGITTEQANAITANTAKTTFPGLGTSSTTALAGDTTTISTAQANEIAASTTLGTKLNVVTKVADANKSTAITFGEFTATTSKSGTVYSLPITVVETDTSGKSPVTTTKTGSITLT
tara:strand:+ start:4228 stop:4809 length:582 start_codon:yes stop_codon:yes gene_type:complete